MYKWILASASPRRKEILSKVIPDFKIVVSEVDEKFSSTKPTDIVKELASLKGRSVLSGAESDEIVVASDTLVFAGDEILGKPANKDEAYRMIKMLSGKAHTVCTGVYVGLKASENNEVREDCFAVSSSVYVDELSDEEILAYIESPEPYDKAGGYAIQGLFGKHITKIDGDYYNIVGFPLNGFYRLCRERGYL